MARNHQELHQVVNSRDSKPPSILFDILLIIAWIGAAVQCVLIGKTVLLDKDIAIAGFSLFFLAIFGLASLGFVPKASSKTVLWPGFVTPVLSGLATLIVLLLLGSSIPLSFAGLLIAFTLMGLICIPASVRILGGAE